MNRNSNADAVRAAAREAEREAGREGGQILSTTEARQGSPRQTNLRVLIVSLVVLAAAGLAFTVAYYGTAVEDHSIPAGEATSPALAPESSAPAQAPAGTQPQP